MVDRRRALTLAAHVAALALAGCDAGAGGVDRGGSRSNATVDWFRENLIRGNVEPRLRHGVLPSGFYQPNLGPDWTPAQAQTATLVSQSRIIYVMAMAWEITGDPRYLDATRRCADYLIEHFADPRLPGRWAKAVTSAEKVASREFHAYSDTQVVFALAHAFRVSKEQRYLDSAMHTWLALDVPGAVARRNSLYDLGGLNVSMHLFEALLALYKVTDADLVCSDLKLLGEYVVTRFFEPQQGVFVERLSKEGTRRPDGEVWIGHSVQIGFLLSRAVDAGLPEAWLKPADAAISSAARIAGGDKRGIIPLAIDYAGNVRDQQYPWWCQAELLRGLAHFAMHRGRADVRAQFDSTLKSVRALYVDPANGSWYSAPNARDQNRGSEWKVGYHVTMMATEIMRLHGVRLHSGAGSLL